MRRDFPSNFIPSFGVPRSPSIRPIQAQNIVPCKNPLAPLQKRAQTPIFIGFFALSAFAKMPFPGYNISYFKPVPRKVGQTSIESLETLK
jgi:hypothetical protein